MSTSHRQFSIALMQTNSSNIIDDNIAELRAGFANLDESVDVVCLPECVNLLERNADKAKLLWQTEQEDAYLAAAKALAKDYKVWIHAGSLVIKDPKISTEKAVNRSFVINAEGEIVARYDKCHLFDVDLRDGSRYRESESFESGSSPVIIDTPFGRWGLAICFDLRFPALFQHYREAGADVVFVPSAFTRSTGEAHWETLLRARAIENQLFIIAAAQVGEHKDGRTTYGHSMVINPWGEVQTIIRDRIDTLYWTVDLDQIPAVRESMVLKQLSF